MNILNVMLASLSEQMEQLKQRSTGMTTSSSLLLYCGSSGRGVKGNHHICTISTDAYTSSLGFDVLTVTPS